MRHTPIVAVVGGTVVLGVGILIGVEIAQSQGMDAAAPVGVAPPPAPAPAACPTPSAPIALGPAEPANSLKEGRAEAHAAPIIRRSGKLETSKQPSGKRIAAALVKDANEAFLDGDLARAKRLIDRAIAVGAEPAAQSLREVIDENLEETAPSERP